MNDYEGSRREFLKLLAEFGEEPAFVARARAAEVALEVLLQNCRASRDEMLEWPQRHLANLAQRIDGDWHRLASLLARPEAAAELAALHAQVSIQVSPLPDWFATDSSRLRLFLESAERFNRHWHDYLVSVDYESVNSPRRDYNQFYSLEKACAFGNEMVSDDFRPLELIDLGYLECRFPYLAIPELA